MTIPFFVVDRSMSLKILEYCQISNQTGVYGVMTLANTTNNFKKKFRNFNSGNLIKMIDSGVFSKEGCGMDYRDLFRTYEYMNGHYGVIKDVLKNKLETIRSASQAMEEYNLKKYKFKLVGVAQGKNINDYIECYSSLKEMGYSFIAIGGLLKKNIKSARWVHVRDENFLENVVNRIRAEYPNDWLFLLGCYHPKRQDLFQKYNIWGGDYKGWIFNYRTPEWEIDRINRDIINNNIQMGLISQLLEKRMEIQRLLHRKNHSIKKKKNLIARRKKIESQIKIELEKPNPIMDVELQQLKTYFLMDDERKRELRFKQIYQYLDRNIFLTNQDRHLLIGCSKKKKSFTEPTEAMELYDGPVFRLLRSLKKQNRLPSNIGILILSAKYGLINGTTLIKPYDQIINGEVSEEYMNSINTKFKFISENKNSNINEIELFVNLGNAYLKVIKPSLDSLTGSTNVIYAKGRIGVKLKQTKEWIIKSFCQ